MEKLSFETEINYHKYEVEYEMSSTGNKITKMNCDSLPIDLDELQNSEDSSHKDLLEILQAATNNNAASFLEDRNVRESKVFGNLMSNAFSNSIS